MSTLNRNNDNYKRLCFVLDIDKEDVFEIMGSKISKSQIDGWGRSEQSVKSGSGNSRASTVSRFRKMSDEHFDDFCESLVHWVKRDDQRTP